MFASRYPGVHRGFCRRRLGHVGHGGAQVEGTEQQQTTGQHQPVASCRQRQTNYGKNLLTFGSSIHLDFDNILSSIMLKHEKKS